MNTLTHTTGSFAGKYLTFRLRNESYGIDVLKVREIIRMVTITPMPQAPPHIRGVVNLRGKIIPVMDLRLRFGIPEAVDTGDTCVVVVKVGAAVGKGTQLGLVVDGVEEVLNIAAEDIEAPPNFGDQMQTNGMIGIAKIRDAVTTLLDIDGIFEPGITTGF